MTMRLAVAVLAVALGMAANAAAAAEASDAPADAAPATLDLAGEWGFRLDPEDQGVEAGWYGLTLSDRIRLPGSLQAQGFGNDVSVETQWTGGINDPSWFKDERYAPYRRPGNVKVPFWLQPRKHYVGPAWYQRTVEIPEAWTGKRIVLFLERCHWATTVWVDDAKVGSGDSLSAPHVYDLTKHLAPGEHRLTIRVNNRMHVDVGQNAHSVTDHTQSNWNGIVGGIELRATGPVWIEDVQVYPNVEAKEATVRITVGNATGKAGRATLRLDAVATNVKTPHDPPPHEDAVDFGKERTTTVEQTYPLGTDAQTWDTFHPALYRLTVALEAGDAAPDAREVVFGVREIATKGTQFVLNGRPLFLRGTLECCIFPKTGYPPTDVAAWKRIIRQCQAHGLNHVRFHSHCPPRAAFVAADELGFTFQVEGPFWTGVGAKEAVDRYVYAETDRIRRAYGNHPSFLLMAYGNEPGGPGRGAKFLGPWVDHCKQTDARHLVTSGSGWPTIPESQYHVTPRPRIHQWGEGVNDRLNARPPETASDYREVVRNYDVPVVSHEIGQWCVYPDLDETAKYTGVLQAKNFEVFRDFLKAAHMGDQARDFLMASGRLQVLCYKEEIESALRTPGFGGFQLLDLHDFPGQGTALVGVLDPFWNSKPYCTPEAYRRFCGPVVPLLRTGKRVLTGGGWLSAKIDVANYGPRDVPGAVVTWALRRMDGQVLTSTAYEPQRCPMGKVQPCGTILLKMGAFRRPRQLKLVVGIQDTAIENDWDLWVYPETVDTRVPDGMLLAHDLGKEAVARLREGGTVLLMLSPDRVRTGPVLGFSSIFWNTAWTRGQPPHTLGILCDPAHPALARFPTESHTNWQWWDLVHHGAAMVLDDLPAGLRPIVQVVPDWFNPKRLGLVWEAKAGGGRLLVCAIDLEADLDNRPVARQLRHSLLAYMVSEAFVPKHEVTLDQVRALIQEPPVLKQLKATASANSANQGYEAARAIDDNPKTMWHTAWQPTPAKHPHHLTLDLGQEVAVHGLTYLPRQDNSANGRIARFAVYTSTDGKAWGQPVAKGTWPNDKQPKQARFAKALRARFVKLVAESEASGNPYASAAEVDVILE